MVRAVAVLVVVLCIAAGMTGASSEASAQISFGWGGSATRERVIESRRPLRGYSGFIRHGNRTLYCDYVRYPNRSCSIDRAGRERCRITSWRLVQSCK